MRTANQIATHVLSKIAAEQDDVLFDVSPVEDKILKGVGATGGGLLGGLFGGAAGAGLGSAIRSFPGYEPTSRVAKALSKTVRNPVGRGVATALPYLGLGTGATAGAHHGYHLFDVGTELKDSDVSRILGEYAQRVS